MDERPAAVALAAIDDVLARAEVLDLPGPTEVVLRLRERIAQPGCRVMIAGRVKCGKSSLVNSLAGADIVPTGTEVATSQAFRIRLASVPRAEYTVVFDDGTELQIGRDDVERFGSQAVIDREGLADNRPIREIQVRVNGTFMPPGLDLLDTPGLGSLRSAHTQVTRRYLPLADAVVVVLDSAQPVLASEVDLVSDILDETSLVLFVQTKIDLHDESAWEAVRTRSSQILDERFGDRLRYPVIWPFSSANLREAATSEHGRLLTMVSGYPDLARALSTLMDDALAGPASLQAVEACLDHHGACRAVLASRRDALAAGNEHAAAVHRQDLERRFQEFNAAWGESGRKRLELHQGIRQITAISRQGFREALGTDGAVGRALAAEIEAVSTLDEAIQLGERLGERTVVAATDAWKRTCGEAMRQYGELFDGFLGDASESIRAQVPDLAPVIQPHGAPPAPDIVRTKGYDLFSKSYGHAMPILSGGGMLVAAIGNPVLGIVMAGGALWAAVRGSKRVKVQELAAAKRELTQHLRGLLTRVQQYFLSVELDRGRQSQVDEYFALLEAYLSAQVAALTTQRVTEARAEFDRLKAGEQLDAQQREDAVEQAQAQLAAWDLLGTRLTGLQAEWQVPAAELPTEPEYAQTVALP